jgi:hypothetical protein
MAAMQGLLAVGRDARRGATTLIAAGALLFALAGTASAATFTPTTFDDNDTTVDPVDGSDCLAGSTDPCTLRDAFQAAQDSSADDEIVLAAGRYELDPDKGGNLSVQQEGGHLLVRGQGARTSTIDGNGTQANRNTVIEFLPAADGELRDLAITGGYWSDGSGSAILLFDSREEDDPTALLTRVRVFDNHNTDGDGGAIDNEGKLTIVESLLDGNTAGRNGGAIENEDELTVVNSTLSGNTALGDDERIADGGAIHNSGSSSELPFEQGPALGSSNAAIPDKAPFLLVENSTITDNHAPNGLGGGVFTERDQCSLAPSLGGGCDGGPSALALFHNSIVSANTADGDANCFGNEPQNSQFASSEGYNLEDGDSCLFTATGDKLAATNIDGLADNGGGTDTHKLRESSVAVDGGDPGSCQTVDQRGVARPQRVRCDIGAFELEPLPVPQPAVVVAAEETPIQQAVCKDHLPPITTLGNSGLTLRSRSVTLKGRSRDLGAPCPSGVERVEVTLAQVSGTGLNCKFVRSSARFVLTPFRNCRRQSIRFRAKGTTRWSFKFNVALAPGKYRATARGYDVLRHKETPKKRRNIIYFEVK